MAINVKIGSGSPLSVQTISNFVGAPNQTSQVTAAFTKANAAFDAANTKLSLTGGIVSGNISPSIPNFYNLGTVDNPWHSIYVGPDSLYIGNTTLSSTSGGGLTLTDADGNVKNLTNAGDQANAAFVQANAAFAAANSAVSSSSVPAFNQANAAFDVANTALQNTSTIITSGNLTVSGNISVIGITISSNNFNGNAITVDAGLF